MFTLFCVPVGLLIVVEFPVMFLSSKYDTPTDMPALRRPFSQIALLEQQLCSLVPPLGRAVQAESVRRPASLSRYGPGGK